jgi:DNA-directed RNA polymerase subunit RPC12/RpoP
MKDIKFDEANKQYICRNCYDAKRPKGSVAPRKSNVDPDKNGAEKLLKSMIRYNCPKCKYHFSRAPGAEVKDCPYCGFKGVEQANKDPADKILKDVDGW